VPGQVASMEILRFMMALDVSEIHGYRAELGLRIFTQKVLERSEKIKINGSNRSDMATKNTKTLK